jgi:hypothetical protein
MKYVFPYFFDVLRSTVELLVGEREEQFEFERAIRLMEFQTWIYWPGIDTNMPNIAGLMAAVLLLENIEDDIFADEADFAQRTADPDNPHLINLTDKPNATLGRITALRSNQAYRGVHDYIFAARGSLEALLYCPSPEKFDADLERRRVKAQIAADLIDYRLRHAQHGSAYPDHGTNRHAAFFKWWPTYDVPGQRGTTVVDKSPSTKTIFSWAKEFHITSIFIYLNETGDYSQIPEFGNEAGDFLRPLRAAAEDVDELRRFFGTYAYIAETIEAAGGERPSLIVPPTVPRVEIQTAPFTQPELQVIADYSQNAVLMDK